VNSYLKPFKDQLLDIGASLTAFGMLLREAEALIWLGETVYAEQLLQGLSEFDLDFNAEPATYGMGLAMKVRAARLGLIAQTQEGNLTRAAAWIEILKRSMLAIAELVHDDEVSMQYFEAIAWATRGQYLYQTPVVTVRPLDAFLTAASVAHPRLAFDCYIEAACIGEWLKLQDVVVPDESMPSLSRISAEANSIGEYHIVSHAIIAQTIIDLMKGLVGEEHIQKLLIHVRRSADYCESARLYRMGLAVAITAARRWGWPKSKISPLISALSDAAAGMGQDWTLETIQGLASRGAYPSGLLLM
jgi:hypothetical protein